MTSLNDPVVSDQLRLTVEMGDDYTPSARVAAALNELSEALEADDADVEGFAMEIGAINLKSRSFAFDSLKLGQGSSLSVDKGNHYIDKSSPDLRK